MNLRPRDWAVFAAATVVAAAAIVSKEARAAEETREDWLTASLASYHFSRKGQNELNLGLGVEIDTREWKRDTRLSLGIYNNSSNDFAAYLNSVWLPWQRGAWKFGGTAGLAYGYGKSKTADGEHKKNDNLLPFFAGVAAYEGKRYGANLLLVPAGSGLVGLQLKMRW